MTTKKCTPAEQEQSAQKKKGKSAIANDALHHSLTWPLEPLPAYSEMSTSGVLTTVTGSRMRGILWRVCVCVCFVGGGVFARKVSD